MATPKTIFCVICCNANFTYLPWASPDYMLECGWERHEGNRWICPDCIDRRIEPVGANHDTARGASTSRLSRQDEVL